MPNEIITPTTTPYESPTVKLTPENVQNIVNAISNYRADQRADYKAQNPNAFQIKPNMISGYGTKPLDYDFSYYNENDLPIPQGYDTIYGKFEDEGVSGWLDQKVQSARDEDLVRRAFNVLQAQNDFNRRQHLDERGANMRNENLYGETLAQMLADRQTQAPAALTSSWTKPAARPRNITGRPSFEEGGAWIPADGELW